MGNKSLYTGFVVVLIGVLFAPFLGLSLMVVMINPTTLGFMGDGSDGDLGDRGVVVEVVADASGKLFLQPSTHSPTVVVSQFGYRLHPVYGDWRLHAGVDYRAYCGTPIIAAGTGTVTQSKLVSGLGEAIQIQHNFETYGHVRTVYGHLSVRLVHPGQQVQAGEIIGLAGTTGTSTACHLHFEVRLGSGDLWVGDPINPIPLTGTR